MAKDKEQKKRKNTEEEKKSKKPKSSSTAEVSGNEWMESNRISVKDSNGAEWAPVLSFDDTALSKKVLYATKNFDKPTPIQSICWPILLKNRDIIAIAETGSGKTLGFGLPAISKLYAASKSDDDQKKRKKPTVLVLSPTRELASQTNEQMLLACKKIGATSTVIFGGVSKDDQRRSINAGTEILVACPGRLIDLVEDGSCSLSSINYVVLDEADRLLDLGFEKEIKKIISLTRKDRQTAMFSATWPTSVQKLAQEYLNAPVKVTVGSKTWAQTITSLRLSRLLSQKTRTGN
jgi:ATP-dependent RNA helicase DBP3